MPCEQPVRLALIGSGIERSWAPRLHEAAGRLCGLDVRYALRPLEDTAPGAFAAAMQRCVDEGCTGINVTHPFKETAAGLVHCASPVGRLGAVNTVRFGPSPPHAGHNTDHTGFMRAWRRRFADAGPGDAAVLGTGGAGHAVAFALALLGARRIRLHDRVPAKAVALAADLRALDAAPEVVVCEDVRTLLRDADGLANCTPVGMHRHPGIPVPEALLAGRGWVFDAVYTPLDTPLLRAAASAGARVLGGFELFLFQGIDAFEIFTGRVPDEAALRRELDAGAPRTAA